MNLAIDVDIVEWLYSNVLRPARLSDFVNDALREKIAKPKKSRT